MRLFLRLRFGGLRFVVASDPPARLPPVLPPKFVDLVQDLGFAHPGVGVMITICGDIDQFWAILTNFERF
jgi:hypothetical protein